MKCQHISTNDDGCWVCSSIRPCMALLWIIWWSSLPARNVPILEADPKVDHQHLVELSLHCRVISPPSRLIIYWWWYIYIVWLTLITSYSHSCRLDEILSTNRCKSMQIRAYLHLQSSTFVNQLDPFLFIKFSRGFDPENSRTAGDPWEIAQGPWSAQWSVERSQACAHWSRTAEDRWRKSSAVKQHRCGTPARNVQCWLSNSN